MNRVCGEQIGKSIGKVVEVDLPDDAIGWGKFLRIKIEVKLNQALSRGRMIRVNDEKVWIPIKYEELPQVCLYGYLVHEREGCLSKSGDLKHHAEQTQQFGTSLRAESTYLRRSHYSEDIYKEKMNGGCCNESDGHGRVGKVIHGDHKRSRKN